MMVGEVGCTVAKFNERKRREAEENEVEKKKKRCNVFIVSVL
jgi:hypothetical protein